MDNGLYPKSAENIKKVIGLYKKLAAIRGDAEQIKNGIELFLAARNAVPTRTENNETKEFYTVYFQGIDDELRNSGNMAAKASTLGIVNRRGDLKPDKEIFFDSEAEQEPEHKIIPPAQDNTWKCPDCGHEGNIGLFCPSCGAKKPEEKAWTCPTCGHKRNTGMFCPVCGTKKPEEKPSETWKCPNCGQEGNTGMFCSACGTKKPSDGPWTCPTCGQEGNTGNFCSVCGSKKP